MVKLAELLQTKYLAEHFNSDVYRILKEHKEIDIAGVKLTPAISLTLMQGIRDGVVIRDSEDTERDNILIENKMRLQETYTTTALPLFNRNDNIVEYIGNLEESTVYMITNPKTLSFPLAFLIQIFKPNIQMDFATDTFNFFKYITNTLYRKDAQAVVNSTNTFTLFIQDTYQDVTITEKDMDKEFYIEATGKTTWNKLITMYSILPSYFGKVKTQRDENLSHIWNPLVTKALGEVEDHFKNQKKSLKEFLEGDGL